MGNGEGWQQKFSWYCPSQNWTAAKKCCCVTQRRIFCDSFNTVIAPRVVMIMVCSDLEGRLMGSSYGQWRRVAAEILIVSWMWWAEQDVWQCAACDHGWATSRIWGQQLVSLCVSLLVARPRLLITWARYQAKWISYCTTLSITEKWTLHTLTVKCSKDSIRQ